MCLHIWTIILMRAGRSGSARVKIQKMGYIKSMKQPFILGKTNIKNKRKIYNIPLGSAVNNIYILTVNRTTACYLTKGCDVIHGGWSTGGGGRRTALNTCLG